MVGDLTVDPRAGRLPASPRHRRRARVRRPSSGGCILPGEFQTIPRLAPAMKTVGIVQPWSRVKFITRAANGMPTL